MLHSVFMLHSDQWKIHNTDQCLTDLWLLNKEFLQTMHFHPKFLSVILCLSCLLVSDDLFKFHSSCSPMAKLLFGNDDILGSASKQTVCQACVKPVSSSVCQ